MSEDELKKQEDEAIMGAFHQAFRAISSRVLNLVRPAQDGDEYSFEDTEGKQLTISISLDTRKAHVLMTAPKGHRNPILHDETFKIQISEDLREVILLGPVNSATPRLAVEELFDEFVLHEFLGLESTASHESARLKDQIRGETTEHATPPRLEDEGQSGG